MEGFDMSANEISFEDFTRFRHKYFEQIEKIERYNISYLEVEILLKKIRFWRMCFLNPF